MKTWFNAWRAAVRIARRDAWRFKGRSFLVLAMIALPIVGVSAMDLTMRSAELSTGESLNREIGAADAQFADPSLGGTAILQKPDGIDYRPKGSFDDKPWPDGPTDLAKAVPAGARVLEKSTSSAKVHTTQGLLNAEIHELKAADPMARGIMTLKGGRFPEKGSEVAATTKFLKNSGLKVGSKLTARGLDADYRIVGSYELPSALDTEQINALPGALIAPLAKALRADGLPTPQVDTTLLVSTGDGFTWNMVQEANTKGIVVTSRAVVLNPPADADVPLLQLDDYQNWEMSEGASTTELAILATVVGLAMLEICLLAGPAFAVGARRSRRQLGLVGANGGGRPHIRAIVLSGGLVIGVTSAVVGTVLGIGLTAALRPVLEEYLGQRFGGFELRPLEILGIALLAVITGLLSALVPAITASRQSVLASLTGRRGVRRSSRVLPLVGLAALLLGGAIALYGSVASQQFTVVAGGSALAELGIVAMTPALVGLFGRVGRWLPLSPRLALRDAVRNRGRTAPAVAAVLAAVAGTVAVSTYAASTDAESRADYVAQLPGGAASFTLDEDGGRDVPTVRAAFERALSIDVQAPVDRIVAGDPKCEVDECGYYEVVMPKGNACPLWDTGEKSADEVFSTAERKKLAKDPRCNNDSDVYSDIPQGVLVADAKMLKVLGIKDPGAEKALADGQVVSLDKWNVDADGKIGIRMITDMEAADRASEKGEDAPGDLKSFTAHQVPGDPEAYGVSVILTPATAESAGISTVPAGAYYSLDRAPSSEQKQRLDSEIAKTGSSVRVHIEEGYTSRYNLTLLVLTVFAGLITIGAAGIATGLAQADAEADLKTLASVGAPGRVRRTLSGFQCGVVAVMGVVLGSAAGVLPAIGLRLTEEREQLTWYHEALDEALSGTPDVPYVPIVIPWETMAMLLIAVPVGAALLAALVTRSHRTLGRRAAT
ncbi:ABC transporter permease [Streptomyces corynorhini]|uniref:ABC transporter permease n=1 Tax=Streptomyces corynorhini TaxID=2282652 RepID=A0A370AT12_9ACTN|nr:ABC transporter permease [Streptomyces corynorhini]RDG31289.1 ABC transporter permease [Streptomyces corynorhini]